MEAPNSLPAKELPHLAKVFLEFITALVIAALAGLVTTAPVQMILGTGAIVVGLIGWSRKIPHAYVLSLAGIGLFAVGIWNSVISPPRPTHFAGRMKEVYENSLTHEQRKKLGKFVGDTYVYENSGCQYT